MSRNPLGPLGCALALIALAGCAGGPESRTAEVDPEMRRALEAANRKMEAFVRADRFAEVATLYADNALLLGPRGTGHQGREAIDAYWAGFGRGIDWRLESLEIEGKQNLAVQRGISTLTYEKRGERRTSVVDFVLVWEKQAGGEWLVVVDAYW